MEQRPADEPQLGAVLGGRRRALLCALGAALLLLLAACAACVARAWIPRNSEHPGTQPGSPLASRQKKLAYARLLARNALLENGTLSWHSHPRMTGVLLSENLSYNESQQELVVAKAGLYYVFLQLNLQPIRLYCEDQVWGQVSLTLNMQSPQAEPAEALVLTVDLFPWSLKANIVEGFQARIVKLDDGHRLSVRLSAGLSGHNKLHEFWELAQSKATVLGLFSVHPLIPADLFSMCSPCAGSAGVPL
uniref:tumor necrosis factor ligand superfamily member 9 n=1 Tax=Jaculus jaculus TaxID=51337 RepID=UPI0003333FFC|nr:tumor necrosis factor ligand superfamily member 9 [Jaculus jaculus]